MEQRRLRVLDRRGWRRIITDQMSNLDVPSSDLLKTLQWHINRTDVQRSASWSRAGSVLSANALVVAGATVLARSSSQTNVAIVGATLLPFVAALLPTYEASTVIAGPRSFGRRLTNLGTPPSILYSMIDTPSMGENLETFKALIRSRSASDEIDGAICELWRLGLLHEARSRHLHRATRWFILAIPLLALSIIVEFAVSVFS